MTDLLQKYLESQDKSDRIDVLSEFEQSEEVISVSMSHDLLSMNIDTDEKIAILKHTFDSDTLLFEHFLTSSLDNWPQSLSAFALRTWAQKSSHLLWFRLVSSARARHLPQRIRYTILDLCPYMAGDRLLSGINDGDGLSELSPAFHSLLLHRCLQWSVFDERVNLIASKVLDGLHHDVWHTHKAMNAALFWFRRFDPSLLHKLGNDRTVHEAWRDQIRVLQQFSAGKSETLERAMKALDGYSGADFWNHLEDYWPPLFARHELTGDFIAKALEKFSKEEQSYPGDFRDCWIYLAGVNRDFLQNAVLSLKNPLDFARAVKIMQGFFGEAFTESLVEASVQHLQQTDSPEEFLRVLPMRLKLALTPRDQKSNQARRMQMLLEEEKRYCESDFRSDLTPVDYFAGSRYGENDLRERISFFNLAYRNRDVKIPEKKSDNFWSLLSHNWLSPDPADLSQLAVLARQEPRIFHICYIHTLARFRGHDEAALKLLDYIRTNRENELQEVIWALGGIDTARSSQELVACITRPNITVALQLEICALLKGKDLSSLQSELRSAIDDLNYKAEQNEDIREVCEALSALLTADTSEDDVVQGRTSGAGESSTTSEYLDESLTIRIPQYQNLSSEVRRALRTAQFFYLQVEGGHTTHAIDLSPVIDMQYKALELVFRESFEDPSFKIINQGILQRKLDVIGYSRPIPKAMEEFENYIGSLPVINEIPYFSKFKLRKMLRAICQYRPGRRFTLDGIKAFSLFFLCFGRKKCQYGLGGIVPLNFPSDEALFHFCKILHVFQDFRNRAAHEGFRPEARNDMEGIWDHTSEIIKTVFEIRNPVSRH